MMARILVAAMLSALIALPAASEQRYPIKPMAITIETLPTAKCKSSGRRTAALLLTNAAAQLADTAGIFAERRLSPPSCTHGCALSQKVRGGRWTSC